MNAAGLRRLQRWRKLVILAGITATLAATSVTRSVWSPDADIHNFFEFLGTLLIVFCVLGRTWSSFYIGGSKRVTLVDTGPFSLVRNPLYVFTIIGACGIGLCTGSMVVGLVLGAATFVVFHIVVLSEETYLRDKFGLAFEEYCRAVPRWIPRPSAWRDAEWVTTRPSIVLTTFIEASLFLIAVPLFELIEYLQGSGVLPVLLHLP